MDEEKATAYYDEMRRKGGGAARLKQGLGYGTQSSDPLTATATADSPHPSFSSFVKGGSHADSLSRFEKETRLAAVRDKLKKRPVAHDDDDDALDHNGHLAKRRPSPRSRDRDHTSRRERDRRHKHLNHGSHSGSSCSRDRRPSSRSSSGSSHDSGCRTTSRRSSSRRRHRNRSCSPSDSNRKSRPPSRSRSRERSISSADERERRKRESTQRARRRSRSGSRLARQPSRRSRSSSPRAYSSDDHHHSRRESYMGSHRSLHRSRRSRSPYMERKGKTKSTKEDMLSAKKPKACDYSKLIPGFDDMTPGEKVKEKMRLQLSETVSKDTAKGMSSEWERFDFNKDAPLDDDAKLDYFGDGTGAHDDTGFLQNTGSTFLSSCSQARREAQIQEAHDAAIFGPPMGTSRKQTGSCKKQSNSFSTMEESATGTDTMVHVEEAPPANDLLSDQVLTLQQGSWRERALKLKQQRAASTTT